MKSLRRTVVTLCATVGLVAGVVVFASPASAEAPPTSTAAVSGRARATGYPTLTNVRWAKHDTYDRIVFDFKGGTPNYRVAYGTLDGLGTGDAIALAGNADLIVDFEFARAHDDNGNPTYAMKTRDPLLPTLRQVKWGGDFEGHVRAGLGLRDKAGFRVTILSSPPRVVVDMSHFLSAAVSKSGTAPNVVVDRLRAAKQTGWDRLVFDVRGTAKPAVLVRYSEDTSLLLVRLSGKGTSTSAPHASYGGPSPIDYGFPGLDRVRLGSAGSGVLVFRVATNRRHGFRVSVLTSPVRVVVDVAH